jgi:ribosomal protein L37AE/L43A
MNARRCRPTQPREMVCPRCGEVRLVEQVDAHRWFCNLCAHVWIAAVELGD